MADPIEACQAEFSHLSTLQTEKHTIKILDEEIESIFAGAVNKRTWYSTFPHKLESECQDDKIKFKSLHTPHYLAHVYLEQQMPALRVKEKYKKNIRICWPHNCGNNISIKGEFVIGSSNCIQTIDCKWMDDYVQFLIDDGYENFIHECQGNLPFLEQWSTFLPEYTLTPMQPYFIDSDTEEAFPIYRINPQTEITFKYRIRRNFRDLLRMQKRLDNEWKDIAFNKSYIEGNFGKDELPLPNMWGIYYRISKAEISSLMEKDENGNRVDRYEQMINEIIVLDKDDKHTFGTTANVELHSAHPCKFVTIKAENALYEKTRNYSNYTTDINVYEGWSPIKRIPSLSYGPIIKMENLEQHHTARMFPYYHCPRVPYEKGYNIIPFSSRVADYGFDVGVILSNLKVNLQVELGNTNPMNTSVQIYKEDNIEDDAILQEDEDQVEIIPASIDEVLEEKEEEVKSDLIKKTKFKLVIRTVINKTLIYTRSEESNYFDVTFLQHEENIK